MDSFVVLDPSQSVVVVCLLLKGNGSPDDYYVSYERSQ